MRWPRSPAKNKRSSPSGARPEKAQLRHAEILGFVHDDVAEGLGRLRVVMCREASEDLRPCGEALISRAGRGLP